MLTLLQGGCPALVGTLFGLSLELQRVLTVCTAARHAEQRSPNRGPKWISPKRLYRVGARRSGARRDPARREQAPNSLTARARPAGSKSLA